MKHLIIDGYNLLFLVGFPGTDLHEQRSTLLKALSDYATLLNLNALIVFDSHYQKGECTHTTQRDISILYTNEGETADDHILSLIKSTDKPEALTVVTSDKRLACKVRALHAKTQEVKSFFEELKHRTAKKIHPPSQKPLLPNITAPKPKQKETQKDTQSDAAMSFDTFYNMAVAVFLSAFFEGKSLCKGQLQQIRITLQEYLPLLSSPTALSFSRHTIPVILLE